MTAPVASRLERLPGGACTHWKAPPCHGAHVKRTLRVATANGSVGREARLRGSPREGPESARKPSLRCELILESGALQALALGCRHAPDPAGAALQWDGRSALTK